MTVALWASMVQAETSENTKWPDSAVTGETIRLASADVTVSIRPVPRPAVEALRVSAAVTARFQAWLGAFQERARQQGITERTLNRVFSDMTFDEDILKKDRNQAEFSKPIWEDLDSAVSDSRVSNGRAAMQQHRQVLKQIEAEYGVEKEVVTAIWGLETSFGS